MTDASPPSQLKSRLTLLLVVAMFLSSFFIAAFLRRLVPLQADPAVLSALPDRGGADAVPLYLVDPGGYVALRYPAGFDPAGVKKDLGKLLK